MQKLQQSQTEVVLSSQSANSNQSHGLPEAIATEQVHPHKKTKRVQFALDIPQIIVSEASTEESKEMILPSKQKVSKSILKNKSDRTISSFESSTLKLIPFTTMELSPGSVYGHIKAKYFRSLNLAVHNVAQHKSH